jgi:hypothetical protein
MFRRKRKQRNPTKRLILAGLFFGLIFDPEDRSEALLRNANEFLSNCVLLQSRILCYSVLRR